MFLLPALGSFASDAMVIFLQYDFRDLLKPDGEWSFVIWDKISYCKDKIHYWIFDRSRSTASCQKKKESIFRFLLLPVIGLIPSIDELAAISIASFWFWQCHHLFFVFFASRNLVHWEHNILGPAIHHPSPPLAPSQLSRLLWYSPQIYHSLFNIARHFSIDCPMPLFRI